MEKRPILGPSAEETSGPGDVSSAPVGPAEELLAYGPEMIEPAHRSRSRLRQVVLVALMMVTGGLVFVLPEPNDETFEISSEIGTAIRIGAADDANGAKQGAGADSGSGSDELALAGADRDARRYAEAPESSRTGDGNRGQWSAGEIPALSAARPTTSAPPTTVAETAAPSTTTEPEAAPTTTEPAGGGEGTETSVDDSSAAAPETDSAGAEQTDPEAESASSESTTGDTGEDSGAAGDGSSDESAGTDTTADPPATDPPTTEPPTTEPPTTEPPAPADPAWVNTGNGVLVPPVLLAIRFCESTDNYTAANPYSSARGGYQFLTGSWAAYGHKDRYGVNQAHLASPAQQDEAALITWQRDGTRPWNASRSCWSRRI